jgi:hypothetical protein
VYCHEHQIKADQHLPSSQFTGYHELKKWFGMFFSCVVSLSPKESLLFHDQPIEEDAVHANIEKSPNIFLSELQIYSCIALL